ncbi:MAG: response regulator transcription factor [Clostridiales bacterium]|jgi:DNA-binding response OmpR family regulator|nr:response regulator transcription factor [Clostridiales bacterium]
MKVLIVDDEQRISELISMYLNKEGYETKEIYDGGKALEAFASFKPDLVVLDLMLPGKDGYQICSEIRKTSMVPIIMLTAKGETFDKVLGLELGADDYMVKPFESKELVARIKAVLRRYENMEKPKDPEASKQISLPNLTINQSTYTVTYHGKELELPPKEFELLLFLASHPNQVFSREQLIERIWGYEFMGDTRTVDVHVKRLREKMQYKDVWNLKTIWSVGYKLEIK